MNDESIIYFGAHKNKALIDIPDDYLYWLYKQTWITDHADLYEYLEENIDAIKNNLGYS